MAVTGRKPKPAGQAVTRHKQIHDWVEIPNVPYRSAPKLPERQPGGAAWPAQTKRWWRVISSMPHCVLWAEADWVFAEHTARLVAAFDAGELRLATEIRNREKLLGTTVDFRRDLRIRYVDAAPTEAPGVTNLDDYRNL